MRPASCLLARSSNHWFDHFQCDSVWNLPNEYGEEIMMCWCLARGFEPRLQNGLGLQEAAERLIFRHANGPIESFGWPIRQDDLDDMEVCREWLGEYR